MTATWPDTCTSSGSAHVYTVNSSGAWQWNGTLKARVVKASAECGHSVAVAGDVRQAELVAQLERAFGGWKGGAPAPSVPPRPAEASGAKVVLVDRPGLTQSSVSVAVVGPPRIGPDHDAIVLMNTLLGGYYGSRLNANLRERHAYTYGVRSSFDFRRGPGPWSATGTVVRDKDGISAALIVAGLPILLDSFARFALQGLGTPAPVMPPKRLVVTGLYRYVRNPMYVAVTALIAGQNVLFGSVTVLEYGAIVWAGFFLFVLAYEEPALGEQFVELDALPGGVVAVCAFAHFGKGLHRHGADLNARNALPLCPKPEVSHQHDVGMLCCVCLA